MQKLMCVFLTLFSCVLVVADEPLDDPRFIYTNALKEHAKTKAPLVVILGAQWCGPCHEYKSETVKKIAKNIIAGEDDYILAVVDTDKQPDLSKQILGGDHMSLPYTAIYIHGPDGTIKRHFDGKATYDFLMRNIHIAIKKSVK